MKIRLLPANLEFEQPPGVTLLDAALRAHVNINFMCANGSCGECRARKIEGDLVRVQAHDAALSERERADGVFLMCSYSASSDAVIDTDFAAATHDVPTQRIETRVRKVERVGDRTVVLHLRTPRSQPLQYHAGQRVRLDFPGGLSRTLSVASCPCDPMNLQFHCHAGDDMDLFTRTKSLRTNDVVHLIGPEGQFTLHDSGGRALWFIAWERGFAPVKSLLEHALSLELEQPMHVIWLSASDNGHYLSNWLRSLSDALDNLTCHTPTPGSSVEATLTPLLDASLEHSDVYIAAPTDIARAIGALCLARGLPPERLVYDYL